MSAFSTVDDPIGVIAVALLVYIVVYWVKQSPHVNNRMLPIVALVLGGIFGLIIGSFIKAGAVEGLLTGAISGGLATYGQEVYKSLAWLIKWRKEDEETTSEPDTGMIEVQPEETTTTTTVDPNGEVTDDDQSLADLGIDPDEPAQEK